LRATVFERSKPSERPRRSWVVWESCSRINSQT